MKQKKLLMLGLLCSCCFGVAAGVSFATADEAQSVTINDTVAQEYGLGETLSLVGGSVTKDGQTYALQTLLTYPNGNTTTYKEAVLGQIGEYTLTYFYKVDGTVNYVETKTFETVLTPTNFFETTGAASLEANVDAKPYAYSEGNGVEMTFTSAADTVKFATPIDVADNTKNDTLLEYIVSPEIEGIQEMTFYNIRLTDSMNPDIWINLNFEAAAWGYEQNCMLKVSANTTEGTTYGNSWTYGPSNGEEIYNQTSFTHLGRCGVYGKVNGMNVMTTKIYYDATEKAVYARTYHDWKLDGYLTKIVDLDDPEIVSEKYVWSGFPSGKANMEISVTPTQTAHILFYKVDGTKLSGKSIQGEYSASIDVNASVESFNGITGAKYPVFEASGSDSFGNVYENLDVAVYRLETVSGKKTYRYYPVKNGYFETPVAGEYVIEYSFKDLYGTKQAKTVSVLVEDETEALTYIPNAEMAESYYVGNNIFLLEGEVQGAIGEYTVTAEAYFAENGGQNPVKAESFDYGSGEFVKFEKAGVCYVNYKVVDALGRTFEGKVYEFAVVYPTGVVVDTPSLPKAVFKGAAFTLPAINAHEYKNGQKTDTSVSVFVNNTDVTSSMTYTPATTDSLTVSYRAADGTVLYENTVLVKEKNAEAYCHNFFVYENMTAEAVTSGAASEYVLSATSAGDAKASFIRKISDDDLSAALDVKQGKEATAIVITFTDSVNAEESVRLIVKKGTVGTNTVAELYINDTSERAGVMAGSIDGNGTDPVKVQYLKENFAIADYMGDEIAKIGAYANGEKFNGFTSGFAYVEVEFIGVAEDFEIVYLSVSNQTFGSAPADTTAPSMNFGNSANSKIATFGSVIAVEKPVVTDVYSDTIKLMVTITVSPVNGESRQLYAGTAEGAPEQLTLSEYGVYVLAWAASDGRNSTTIVRSYEVLDTVAPALRLESELVSSYSTGALVKFPKATVDGEGDYFVVVKDVTKERVYACTRNSSGEYTFTFRAAGNYKIVYIAYDSNMNRTEYEFNVVVK